MNIYTLLTLVTLASALVTAYAPKKAAPRLTGKYKKDNYHIKERSYVSDNGYGKPKAESFESYEEDKEDYANEVSYDKKDVRKVEAVKKVTYETSYLYQGKYPGKCAGDGLYYKDESSFVYCSNGNSFVQPCAPGTRNSGYDNFRPGGAYGYRDFCDVNLVDSGYAAQHYRGHDGYGGHRYGGYDDGYYGGYRGHYYGHGRPFERFGYRGYGYMW